MKATIHFLLTMVALVSALTLAACGGTSSSGGTAGGPLTVEADGENLAFKPTALTAKAGAATTVTFKNISTAQQHNWVLVQGGEDVAAQVDEAGVAAGAPDYLAADKANVVAATKMLAAGGSETLNFTAPAAGTYTFMCTYPGHFAAGMKGTLTVAP